MPRKILIVVFAAVGVLADLRAAPASGAPRYGNFNLWNPSGVSLNQRESRKTTERQSVSWAFYADLSYYADPEYFLRCYQRTRIETLYWVAWRPVRVCSLIKNQERGRARPD